MQSWEFEPTDEELIFEDDLAECNNDTTPTYANDGRGYRARAEVSTLNCFLVSIKGNCTLTTGLTNVPRHLFRHRSRGAKGR